MWAFVAEATHKGMKRFLAATMLPLAPLMTIAAAPVADPYAWLEDIEGARALGQVKAWNAETEAALTRDWLDWE